MAGTSTNQLPLVVPGTSGFTRMYGVERVAADTELASGAVPQSVAATSFQVGAAALAAALASNSTTLATNSATLNVMSGAVTTGSLSTAAGSTYAFTIVNSLASPTTTPFQLGLASVDNTTYGVAIQSASIGTAGTISVTLINNGSAALNGKLLIPFQVGASV